jgi:hypothetical protein
MKRRRFKNETQFLNMIKSFGLIAAPIRVDDIDAEIQACSFSADYKSGMVCHHYRIRPSKDNKNEYGRIQSGHKGVYSVWSFDPWGKFIGVGHWHEDESN